MSKRGVKWLAYFDWFKNNGVKDVKTQLVNNKRKLK